MMMLSLAGMKHLLCARRHPTQTFGLQVRKQAHRARFCSRRFLPEATAWPPGLSESVSSSDRRPILQGPPRGSVRDEGPGVGAGPGALTQRRNQGKDSTSGGCANRPAGRQSCALTAGSRPGCRRVLSICQDFSRGLPGLPRHRRWLQGPALSPGPTGSPAHASRPPSGLCTRSLLKHVECACH